MPSHANIPLFYRIALLWYEPLASGLGAYLVLFEPDKYLNSFVPPSYASRNHTDDIFLNQLAAAFVYVSLSQGVLLRYTNDITIWKIVNACLLGWDFILLYSIWFGLDKQGRLGLAEIRGDDWGVIGATFGMTLIRSALCLGVGFQKEKVRGKRQEAVKSCLGFRACSQVASFCMPYLTGYIWRVRKATHLSGIRLF